MSAIAGFAAAVLITSQPSIALAANFALVDSGDHTTFAVSTGNAAYRYWDKATAMTFQTSPDGSTWTTVAPASIQYVGGKVTFGSAVSGGTPSARVTAGNYYPWAVLANVTDWSFDGERTFADSTTLSGDGAGGAGSPFKVFTPLLLTGTFTLNKFWVPESSIGFVADMTAATPLIISGYEQTGNRYEGYCFDKKLSLKTSVDKLVEESVEFQLSGSFYMV